MESKRLRDGIIDRIVEIDGTDFFGVYMLPYKIQNSKSFYERNHPETLNPFSQTYDRYWDKVTRNIVEGKWIYDVAEDSDDGEGTWVYMMPKLYFYTNIIKIVDEERKRIYPRLRDNEWIMATYYFIMDGFSGFEDDYNYTCCDYIRKIEDRDLEKYPNWRDCLEGFEIEDIENNLEHLTLKNGSFKEYIDPWIYLTEHYLITRKQDRPLGLPLYLNQRQNAVLLASRTLGKSFFTFLGDFLHEWFFNGVRRYEELYLTNNDMLFALAASKKDPLERSLANISRSYANLPGKFDRLPDYHGFCYKQTSGGSWIVDNLVRHEVKKRSGAKDITGNQASLLSIKPNNAKIVAGDRFRRIYLEECGFIENIREIQAACENSLKVGERGAGSLVAIGTGGESSKIEGSKDMFENPRGYNVCNIRDFYNRTNTKARSGLFVSVVYAAEEFKDPQGNTLIKESLARVIQKRIELKKEKDAASFIDHVMFNPIYPKEMLIPKTKNKFPTAEMATYRADLVSLNTLESPDVAMGTFHADKNVVGGVRFDKDFKREFTPIVDWGREDNLDDLRGVCIMYEDVIDNPPDGLYHVIVDPVSQSGKGASLNSIMVYKADFGGNMGGMRDNIVLEWTGRTESITDTYEIILLIAKYYSAQIFQERNIPYMLEWASDNECLGMFSLEPLETLNKLHKGKIRASHWGRGVKMNATLNAHAYLKLSTWFKEVIDRDKDGVPTKKKFQEIKSLRILSEAINYEPEYKTKFDALSSLYLLMILKTELEGQDLVINLDAEDAYEEYDNEQLDNPNNRTIEFLKF